MFGIINFETFLIAGILLILTPGTDTMYILGRSISQGKKAGLMSALGISTGVLVHCLFATLGLSIILAKSALAFEVVKYLGATYLIFLGIKSIVAKPQDSFELDHPSNNKSLKKIYMSGVLTNVLNPKVALFFLAFIPQFVDPGYSQSALTFSLLGFTFLIMGTVWCLLLAFFASILSGRMRANYKFKTWLDRVTGMMFIGLGIKLAMAKK
ncbi:resistance to homoserine/threonine (RhtB) family protein [Reichenbachiella faecimaris]|uniref:Resistance to homoserine/threonine (RhtB) family protein n=1 Tax=Reichenbachiella faecimaris TaxID=692418 RepID=A0A1W2GPA3_REIFA|nr:LysE family translocator [Reichenbachiella faecimaris]SMD38106.1 resistance to homoserine/threonine (RhtB) family protein [Reichenbachiella faecimaris]